MNSIPSRSLLSIEGMTKSDIEEILDLTDTFDEIGRRPIPKVPALRGRTVAPLFFENSTLDDDDEGGGRKQQQHLVGASFFAE